MSVAASNNEEVEAMRLAQRAHEPSMEEILASIRAIIADDREPAPKPGPQIVYSSDAPRPAPATPTVVWSREEAPATPEPSPHAAEVEPALLSEETESAVAASFQTLSESLTAHGFEVAEQIAREMLRPMLKTWLDEHLPNMVERLVRAEIQRLAGAKR